MNPRWLRAVLAIAIGLAAPLGCARAESATAGSSPGGVPDSVATLTLPEALALVLLHNPGLAAFSAETRAAEARALQAQAYPNPELNMRFDHLGHPGEPHSPADGRARIILGQAFELGGKRAARMTLARAEQDAAAAQYEGKRVEVAMLTASRFAALLGAQHRADVLTRAIAALERAHGIVAERVARGALAEIDGHQVARDLGLARIRRESAAAELEATRRELAALWGARQPRFGSVLGDLEELPEVADFDSLLLLAAACPLAASTAAEAARWRGEVAAARAQRWPDIDLGVGVRFEKETEGTELLVDLDIPLPLLDRKRGSILEMESGLARAAAESEQARVIVCEELARAWRELRAARAEALILRAQVLPAVHAIRDVIAAAFHDTAADVNDLLDAERDLTRAELQYVDALIGFHQALATIEGFLGQGVTRLDTAR